MHIDNPLPITEDVEDGISKCPYCLCKYHDTKNFDHLTEKMSENIYHSPFQSYQQQEQYIMPLSTQNISEIGKVKSNIGKTYFNLKFLHF